MGIYCCSRQPRHRTINIGITTLVHISNDGWQQHKTTPDNSEELVVTPNIGGLLLIRSPWHHGGYTWLVAYIWTTSVSFVQLWLIRGEWRHPRMTTLPSNLVFLSSLCLSTSYMFLSEESGQVRAQDTSNNRQSDDGFG